MNEPPSPSVPLVELDIVGYADVLPAEDTALIVPPLFHSQKTGLFLVPPFNIEGAKVSGGCWINRREVDDRTAAARLTLISREEVCPAQPFHCLWIDSQGAVRYEPRDIVVKALSEITDAQLEQAFAALRQGEFPLAAQKARTALRADDTRLDPYVILAVCYTRAGNHDAAQLMREAACGKGLDYIFRAAVDQFLNNDIPFSSVSDDSGGTGSGSIGGGETADGQALSSQPDTRSRKAPLSTDRRYSVLIADDETGLARGLRSVLLNQGTNWDIAVAESATEAISLVDGHRFDLIAADWDFGSEESTGGDVLEAAKTKDPLVPVFLMTAWAGEKVDRYRDGIDKGALDVIDKNDPNIVLWKEILIKGKEAIMGRETVQRLARTERFLEPQLRTTLDIGTRTAMPSKTVTALSCDIRGFTRLSASLDASGEVLMEFLQRFYELLGSVTRRRHGMIYKCIGDGAMILFGAGPGRGDTEPDTNEDAFNAVTAALELQDDWAALAGWLQTGHHTVSSSEAWTAPELAIGIHCDRLRVGIITAGESDQFMAIGQALTLASRLESIALKANPDTQKNYGSILISQSVFNRVKARFVLRSEGLLTTIRSVDAVFPVWSVSGRK